MAPPQATETISQIKAHVPEHLRVRRSSTGLALFSLSAALYGLTFAIALAPVPAWIRFVASLLNAGFIATLFIVGHDACHGSLTPKLWLNKLIGRLSFLPSWHPFVSWDLGHNRIHHSWTNLKGRDYVWTPLTVEEFQALSPFGRFMHRFYRSLPGVGLYYFWEIWFKHMVFPGASDRKRMSPSLLAADLSLVALFVGAQISLSIAAAAHFQTPVWLALLLAVVLPQILWNQLMGLVILLHHTHPRVKWFDDPDQWSFFNGQVRGTVHVLFPWPLGALLHHIMDHTAHHVDTRIPLYHLPDAQVEMERSYPGDVIVSPFSWPNLRYVLRKCQLYDYARQQWLPFSAARSSSLTLSRSASELLTLEQASRSLQLPLPAFDSLIRKNQLSAVQFDGHWRIHRNLGDPARLCARDAANPPSILVVIACPDLRSYFQHFLQKAGLQARLAESASGALALARQHPFDLAFLGLQLPDTSGDSLFFDLKSIQPRLPVVPVTDEPAGQALNRILSHTPSVVLRLPLDPDQLRLAVELLDHKAAPVGT